MKLLDIVRLVKEFTKEYLAVVSFQVTVYWRYALGLYFKEHGVDNLYYIVSA